MGIVVFKSNMYLLKKILMLGKTERKRRRGQQRMRELDSIAESNGHKIEQTPGDSEGHRSLVCCSPRSRKGSDTTEQLHNKNMYAFFMENIKNAEILKKKIKAACDFKTY